MGQESLKGHRILVCGVGSIGERHLRNLRILGYQNIALYRVRGLPLRTLADEFTTYTDLPKALKEFRPTVTFVTNPTAFHIPVALQAARAGCHLFIEKPVSHTLEGIEELRQTLNHHKRFAMVGYMLRFHPLIDQLKRWIDEGPKGKIGVPIYVRTCWGEHIPDWHPWEDYSSTYPIQSRLGGGVALTLSHHLDLLIWMFGNPDSVSGISHGYGVLEGDCETGAEILLKFKNNVAANVHLDFFQRPPQRSLEVVGTRGRAIFEFHAGTLTHFDGQIGEKPSGHKARKLEKSVIALPEGVQNDDIYLSEIRYFFECLENNIHPKPGLSEAAESVRIANIVAPPPVLRRAASQLPTNVSEPSLARSNELYLEARKLIAGGVHLLSKRPDIQAPEHWPIYYKKAVGARITDIDDNEFIDMTGNVGATLLGHADPDVVAAVEEAVRRGSFCMLNVPEEVELARLLTQIIPCAEKVRFARGGGEADAIAIRIARGFTRKDKVLFCGYHGWHDWYLSANLTSDTPLDQHLLPGIEPRGTPQALAGSAIPFEYNNLESLHSQLKSHQGEIAAVIIEPTRHHPPKEGFLEGVRELCSQHKAVLIFDEVVTGFRMALGGAQEYFKVTPDMAVFAKTISNGHPLGAIVGRGDVMSTASEQFISSTYWTEAIGPVAGLASIRKMQRVGAIAHAWKVGTVLRDGLQAIITRLKLPIEVEGWPPLTILEFQDPDPLVRQAMGTYYLRRNLTRGFMGAKLHYLTYAHTPEIIDAYLRAAEASLNELAQALSSKTLMQELGDLVSRPLFQRRLV